MQNITIGQTIDFVILIASLIGAVSVICVFVKKIIEKQFQPIKEDMKSLDISQCKNFLVRFLADVENGNKLDEAEIERAYEVYDHYEKDLKQNSYIHRKWKKLMDREK